MNSNPQKAKPEFNRLAVFAEVEESNRRFDGYTKEQRRGFGVIARALKPGVRSGNEVRRS
jgi:hypothetical protein